MIDQETLVMPHRIVEHPIAMATSAGSTLAATAMAVGQTASDAAQSVPNPGYTGGAWIAAATAGIAFGCQAYMQWRASRTQADAADAKSRLEQDTREHDTWGGKYESEMERRVQAEARLKIAEEQIARLSGENASQAKEMASLKEEVVGLRSRTGKAVKHLVDKTDAAISRLDAVEAQQGSASNLELPVTPDPKA